MGGEILKMAERLCGLAARGLEEMQIPHRCARRNDKGELVKRCNRVKRCKPST